MSWKHAAFASAVVLLLPYGDSRSLAQSLYAAPEGIETRWASPENPLGEKGKGAQTNAGRKGRPAIPVKAGEQVTLAEVHGSSGTIRRIEACRVDRRKSSDMCFSFSLAEIFFQEKLFPV